VLPEGDLHRVEQLRHQQDQQYPVQQSDDGRRRLAVYRLGVARASSRDCRPGAGFDRQTADNFELGHYPGFLFP
jgi:hypothetical protein